MPTKIDVTETTTTDLPADTILVAHTQILSKNVRVLHDNVKRMYHCSHLDDGSKVMLGERC